MFHHTKECVIQLSNLSDKQTKMSPCTDADYCIVSSAQQGALMLRTEKKIIN